MALPYIQGNDVLLYLAEAANSSALKLWGCCRNVTLTGTTETIELTPLDGVNTDFEPTYNGATLDADGIYIIPEYSDSRWNSQQLWQWREAHTELYWKLVFTKADGSTDEYSGTCFLTDTVVSGAVNDVAGITISAVVTSGNTSSDVQISCPVLTLDSTPTSVSYSFLDGGEGATVYYVNLLDSGNTFISSQQKTAPFSGAQTGNFTGLTPGTTYKVQLQLASDVPYYSRTCVAVTIATEAIPCPTVNFTEGETNIAYSFSDGGYGATTYTVVLYDGLTEVDSDVINAPFSNPITGNFTGLDPDTTYNVVITIDAGAYSRECGPYFVTTGGGVTAYPYTVGLGLSGAAACGALASDPPPVYSSSSTFTAGITLYYDSGLTSLVTGFDFVAEAVETTPRNLNSFTGVVGSAAGGPC